MRFVLLISLLVSLGLGAKDKLPVDKSLQLGELKNGMKYILRHNQKPPGKVSIYLHVSSGSLDEDENQLGLAHFLEHMAFNGSENFWIDKVNFFFDETIFMFMKQVGGRGINWEKLNLLKNSFKPNQSIIAGGIRYWGDIKKLKRLGYKGVIISTLIHKQLK